MGAPQSPPPYEVAAARQRVALAKKWESSLRETLEIAWRQVEQATRGLECAREQVKEAEAELARGGAGNRRVAPDDGGGGGRKRGIKGRAFALVAKSLRHKGGHGSSAAADARKQLHAKNDDTEPDLFLSEEVSENDDVFTQTVNWRRIRDDDRPLSRSVVVTKSSGSDDLITLARRDSSHNSGSSPRRPSQRSLSLDVKDSRSRGVVSCDAEEAQRRSGNSRKRGESEKAPFRRLSTRESRSGSGDDRPEDPPEGGEQQKHRRGSQRDLTRSVEELQRRSVRKSRGERSSLRRSRTKGSNTSRRKYELTSEEEEEDGELKLRRKLEREGYKKNAELEHLERLARKLEKDKMERTLERADKEARRSILKKRSDGSSSRAPSHSSARDNVSTKDKSLDKGRKSRSKSSSLERSDSSWSRSSRSKGGSLERSDSSRKSRSRSDSSQKSRAKNGGLVRTKFERGALERIDSGRVPRSESGSLERDKSRSKSGGSLERHRDKDDDKKRRKRHLGDKKGPNRRLAQSLKETKSKSKRVLLHKSHKARSTKVVGVSNKEDDAMQRLVKEARTRKSVDGSKDAHRSMDKLDILGKQSSSGPRAHSDLSVSSPELLSNTSSIRASKSMVVSLQTLSSEAPVASGSQSLVALSRSDDLSKLEPPPANLMGSDDALDGQEPRRGLLGDVITDLEGNNSSDEAIVRSTGSLNDDDTPPGRQEADTTTSPTRETGNCTSGPVQALTGSGSAQPRRSPALQHRASDVNAHSGSDMTESEVTGIHSMDTEKRAGGKGPRAKGLLTHSIKQLSGMIVLKDLEPPVSPGKV